MIDSLGRLRGFLFGGNSMFHLFQKNGCDLSSPVIGKSIPLEEVKDNVFSSKMMGDGMAFQFDGDAIYAPCDAKVMLIPRSKHAIGLKSKNIEILIHVGLDTVMLNGQGLQVHVSLGDHVKRGDLLLSIDRKIMKENDIDLTTPMIITSKDVVIENKIFGDVNTDSIVFRIH